LPESLFFEQHLRAVLGRVGGGVISRCNFDNVPAHKVHAFHTPDQFEGLARGQPADLRRAGPGGLGGVEAVDIERKIRWSITHNITCFCDDVRQVRICDTCRLDQLGRASCGARVRRDVDADS